MAFEILDIIQVWAAVVIVYTTYVASRIFREVIHGQFADPGVTKEKAFLFLLICIMLSLLSVFGAMVIVRDWLLWLVS